MRVGSRTRAFGMILSKVNHKRKRPRRAASKDLKRIESSANELGMPEVISVYEAAVQQGLARKDIAAIAVVMR
jgi:3-hydroxyisobutyrate dehydrogenase-like beta-hydroxyacid dehydrogenase